MPEIFNNVLDSLVGRLNEKDFDGLSRYRYKSVNKSLLNPYQSKFWRFCLDRLVSNRISPNLLTVGSLLVLIVNAIIMFAVLGTEISPPPRWLYISFAIGVFLNQTLDNLDGMQARRLGVSSPFGQILDNSIDVLAWTIVTIFIAASMDFLEGGPGFVLYLLMIPCVDCCLIAWQEHYTECVYFGEFNGPHEGLATVILVCLWSSYAGAKWWSQSILWDFSTLNTMTVVIVLLVVCFSSISDNLLHVNKAGKLSLRSLKFTLPMLLMFPLPWLHVAQVTTMKDLILLVFTFGTLAAIIVAQVVAAKVTMRAEPPFASLFAWIFFTWAGLVLLGAFSTFIFLLCGYCLYIYHLGSQISAKFETALWTVSLLPKHLEREE